MSTKHTPGPWWVENIECHMEREAYVAYGIQGDLSETYDVYEAYSMADYRLIAAAPDLLAACELLLSANDSGSLHKLSEAIAAARAAIAKATG